MKSLPISLMTKLYPYQQDAVDKLLPLRVGALYMEMGTGKTRTALEIICKRLERKKISSVLWLCPCSVKKNLADDLDKHCTGWKEVITICGIESISQSDRTMLAMMKKVGPEVMCIVDESNLVKNWFALRTKRITELGKVCRYRLILNGTPVSRNEADLYSQWYFLDSRIFGYRTFWSFARNHLEYDDHHKVQRVLDVDYLTEKIAPYSYVIRKDDVLTELPSKYNDISYFDLTAAQGRMYREVMDELLCQVDEFDSTTIYRLFAGLQLVTSGRWVDAGKPMKHREFFTDPKDNPRIQKLLSILETEDYPKTIIWVKYRHEADEISSVLPFGSYAIATGAYSVAKRNEHIDRFRSDPECKYLIANKVCGGYGLNLQFCHRAIYYNNDFNYATRAQSEDRLHRIGQTEEVYITDLAANSKIDERIISCLERKGNLCDDIKEQIKKKKDLRRWLNGQN